MTTTLKITGSGLNESLLVRCNLTNASSPVLVNYLAEDDSEFESTQWQCADTGHSEKGLFNIGRDLLAQACECSIDDLGDIACEDVSDLMDMIAVVDSHGDTFSGGRSNEIAQDWIDNAFDSEDADMWMDAGFWDASTAARVRDGGMTPNEATARELELRDAEDGVEHSRYTDGSPIYAMCNGDFSVDEFIASYDE